MRRRTIVKNLGQHVYTSEDKQMNFQPSRQAFNRGSSPDAFDAPYAFDSNETDLASLWQRVHAAQIQMVAINRNTYLGLVPGRRTTSLLRVGNVLFIFAPKENAVVSVGDFLAQVLRHIPEYAMHDLHNLTTAQLDDALQNNTL